MLIALALAAAYIDPALCRSSGPSLARWSTDGQRSLAASTDAPAIGAVVLRCRIRTPEGRGSVTVSWENTRIQFTPPEPKAAQGGVVLRIGPACEIRLTRVAGEDWIEAPARSISVQLPPGARAIDLELMLRDDSPQTAVRADITGLRVSFGRNAATEPCLQGKRAEE